MVVIIVADQRHKQTNNEMICILFDCIVSAVRLLAVMVKSYNPKVHTLAV